MTPDKSSADEAAEDHALSDDGRPLWAAPQVTKFEVIRTLAGSGTASDHTGSHAPRPF